MDDAEDTGFVLRFAGPVVEARGAAPAAAVAAALDAMQRLAHLVGMQQEGRDLGQPCGVSQPGSLLEPLRLVSLDPDLLADEATRRAGRTLKRFFAGVQGNDAGAVAEAAPDRGYRRLMLSALLAMAPAPGGAVTLDILDSRHALAVSMDAVRPNVAALLRPARTVDHDGILTGTLNEIDFARRTLVILETSSERQLTCLYDESVEPMLLEHPRELIQVHGTIVRDAEGRPASIQDVSLVQPLDLSPFLIEHFVAGNQPVACDPPLDLAVEFDAAAGILTVADADLGIDAYGETRDRLSASLHSELDTLWRFYASADPAELAEDAEALRQRLRERFKARSADAA